MVTLSSSTQPVNSDQHLERWRGKKNSSFLNHACPFFFFFYRSYYDSNKKKKVRLNLHLYPNWWLFCSAWKPAIVCDSPTTAAPLLFPASSRKVWCCCACALLARTGKCFALEQTAVANSTTPISTMPALSGDINPHDRRAPDFNVNRLHWSWSV